MCSVLYNTSSAPLHTDTEQTVSSGGGVCVLRFKNKLQHQLTQYCATDTVVTVLCTGPVAVALFLFNVGAAAAFYRSSTALQLFSPRCFNTSIQNCIPLRSTHTLPIGCSGIGYSNCQLPQKPNLILVQQRFLSK